MFSRDVHMHIEEHKKKYAPFPMHRKEFASQNIYVNYLRTCIPPFPYKNLSTDTAYFIYITLYYIFSIIFEQFASYNKKKKTVTQTNKVKNK